MKTIFNLFVVCFLYTLMGSIHADNEKGTIYHCPNYKDITYSIYSRGVFHAQTDYNGLRIEWYSSYSFPEREVKITGFYLAKRDDCIGGRCTIQCVYHTSSAKNAFLDIDYRYHSEDKASGSWEKNWCFSNSPEQCMFYVS